MTALLPPVPVPARNTWILFLVFCLCAGTILPVPCSALGEDSRILPREDTSGQPIMAGGFLFPLLPVYIAPLQVVTKAPVNVSTTAVPYTYQTAVPAKTPATVVTTSPFVPAATTKAPVNPVITPAKGIPFATMTTRPVVRPLTTTLPFSIMTTYMTQPACLPGMTRCGSGCFDLNTDIDHCGSCDNVCTRCSAAGQQTIECINGHCVRDCGSGYTDIESDPNNCGCCGNVVTPPAVCHDGTYSLYCNGEYVFVSDINNCGACGVQCHPELFERCYNRNCTCINGYSRCNGVCIPTDNDTANCGGCGIRCRADQICHQGHCRCPPSLGIPGGGDGFECGGVCKDLASDILNCGACGHSCGGNAALNETRCDYGECKSICENGQYTNTDTDRNNCGGCWLHCAEWEDCIEGECTRKTCMYGETLCGGTCTDLRSDRNNCGLCGYRCSASYDCVNGQCYNPQSCPSGWADCDEDNRCENLSTGSGGYFCGSCDSMCPHNEACYAGQCVVNCPQGYSKCNRACQNLMSDPENCGGCGNRCTNTEVCEGGQCVTPCPQGTSRCNGTCKPNAEFMVDNNNCGTCGNRCNIICLMGICLFG